MEFDQSPNFALLASYYFGRVSITGNWIGTNANGAKSLGNGGAGITIDNVSNVVVGGTEPIAANLISGNVGDGIEIFGANSAKNTIRGNHIYANGGLGIDINGDGVTPNDIDDGDQGANDQINYPVLSKAVTGTATFVFGNYSGLASNLLLLDFYADAVADTTGFGEGNRYLGSATIGTDAAGMASFQVNLAAPTAIGEVVSATATDLFGNTSEFALTSLVGKAPPTATVQINSGQLQRSMVREVAVTFSESVNFPDGLAAAIRLRRTGPGMPIGDVNLAFAQMGNTVASIFNDPTYSENGSLIDGNYEFTLVAAKINGVGGLLDGNVNGAGGDDQSVIFHRLFGDGDGDRSVTSSDFALFRQTFGVPMNLAFDANNDGNVSSDDFAEFRKRFGLTLVP